jgi:hypothetical protein
VASAKGKKGKSRLATLTDLTGSLLGRLRMAARAGIQFKGNRDIYASAGYTRTPKFQDFLDYYDRNEIGGRIIEAEPKTTWRIPPTISETDNAKETDFTKAVTKLADRLQLWSEFQVADRLSGIGKYGVLLIGVRGVDNNGMAQPLGRLSNPDDVLYVKAYDEQHAQIKSWVTNSGDKRFGLPLTYELKLTDVPGFTRSGLIVHASRVLHIAEDADDRVYGRPRLERVLNRIYDLDKIAASTAESYWQAVARILQAKLDPQASVTPAQLDEMEEKMGEMIHDLRRQFIGQGAGLEWLTTQVSPVKDISEFYFALIAVGSGIPRRILFGNESGQLASSTDEATWFGQIDERQEHFAEPQFVRAFIDRLSEAGALKAPKDNKYEVLWPELFKLTALEQADANLKTSQAAAALTPLGGDPTQLVEVDDDRNVLLVPKKPGNPDDVAPPPAPTPAPPEAGGGTGAAGSPPNPPAAGAPPAAPKGGQV